MSCTKHPLHASTLPECPACRVERIATFKFHLNEAVMDLLPSAMRLVLRKKIERIVNLIAEVVR